MTLVSRVTGFVRDIVIAATFGAGAGADAFFVAFKIPNLFRRLFAEGSFAQAFVPVLSQYREERSPEAVRELIDSVAGLLGVSLLAVTAVGVIAAPVLITLFAPGFLADAGKYELAVGMLRITFPYLLFISLTALAGAILNTWGRFAVPAFTPVFLNLSLIGAAIGLAPRLEQPVTALAWGVFLGGVVQLAFQAPFLLRLRLLPRPRVDTGHAGVRRILRLMLPALFGASITQLNLMLDTLIASFLVTGSVSWLYYSDRLVEFPLGVFGIALATVILPGLAARHAAGEREAFTRTLDWAMRWVAIVATPAALGLAVLAGPLLCTLFQYGALTPHDVTMAARSLVAYAFGLLGFTLVKVLAPGYFARQDTRTPVRIGVFAMLANMVLNVVFVFPLAHAGLALATSCSAFINAGLLLRGLRRGGLYQPQPGWPALLARVAGANACMVAVLVAGVPALEHWVAATAPERAAWLALWIAAGALSYLGCLRVLGVRWRDLRGR